MRRFEVVNYGDYWKIVDMKPLVKNCFEDKESAEKVCDGLNEMFNPNTSAESFKDKVRRAVHELWDDDGVKLSFIADDIASITELKDSEFVPEDIRSVIHDCDVINHPIDDYKSVFIIREVNDDE